MTPTRVSSGLKFWWDNLVGPFCVIAVLWYWLVHL